MDIATLDFYFPFFVFLYGLVVSVPLNSHRLMEIAEEKMPLRMIQQLKAHRNLAMVCLYVGGFWSLQNISL